MDNSIVYIRKFSWLLFDPLRRKEEMIIPEMRGAVWDLAITKSWSTPWAVRYQLRAAWERFGLYSQVRTEYVSAEYAEKAGFPKRRKRGMPLSGKRVRSGRKIIRSIRRLRWRFFLRWVS